MVYHLGRAPKLKSRKVNNIVQLLDNTNSDVMPFLLEGEANSFMVFKGKEHGELTISPPLEDTFDESLPDMIDYLSRTYSPRIHLQGFSPQMLGKFRFSLQPSSSRVLFRLYQHVRDEAFYDTKLGRFTDAGFYYRHLSRANIPSMQELLSRWRDSKMKALLKTYVDADNAFGCANSAIEELISLRDSLPNQSKTDMERWFTSPLTTVYGAYDCTDALVAYTVTEGNDSFCALHYRSSERRNTHSPQEYLDLVVYSLLASRGIKLVDRGFINGPRKGTKGLVDYKKKFGSLEPRIEQTFYNVTVQSTPETEFLDDLYSEV